MARRPKHRKGIRRGRFVDWPLEAPSPEDLADRVSYMGSAVHKTYPSPAGPPAARADKTKCDRFPEAQWHRLLEALRAAILAGCVGQFRGEFPDRVWVWINGVLHEARLTNPETGEYHGFPINDPRQYPEPAERLGNVPHFDIPLS